MHRVSIGVRAQGVGYGPAKAQIIGGFDAMLEACNIPHPKDGVSSNVALHR
jgi:hypothetical protein